MPMPETAVHKDHLAPGCKHEIGLAGQVFAMKAEPIAEAVNQRPDGQFCDAARRFDAAHSFAAFKGG
jgi:hypothetical protein